MLYITVDVDWMVRDVIENRDGTVISTNENVKSQ